MRAAKELNAFEWTISGASFFETAAIQEGEKVLYIGEASSFAGDYQLERKDLTAISPEEHRLGASRYHAALAQLSLHRSDHAENLLKAVFAQLKPGGRFIADLAESETLRYGGPFVYKRNLPDYWDTLREVGFEAIFVQQISVYTEEEVILQGWDDLVGIKHFPVKVNRFVALRGA
ncbi:hypothetical protein [Bacillus xiapuensis]|uniref:hypothetical protein n=1 Tax=Bacillus xiapuensis TaxID=2014075 RepID=UPI000C24888B|nr:hypothetical protein [Bacillus xiapuensis]